MAGPSPGQPFTFMPTEIQLTTGSLELLLGCLSQPKWTKRRCELVGASDVLSAYEPFVFSRPVYAGQIADNGAPVNQVEYKNFKNMTRAWEDELETYAFNDLSFQAVTVCLRHLSDDQQLPSTRFTAQLLRAFKLTE